jgi:hypothetical protein
MAAESEAYGTYQGASYSAGPYVVATGCGYNTAPCNAPA